MAAGFARLWAASAVSNVGDGVAVAAGPLLLGLTEVGFGLLLASSAVGGIGGTLVAARLQARFGTALLLRTGLVIETCAHLSLALARAPWVAVTTMVVFGTHASLWGILSVSWRQRVVPETRCAGASTAGTTCSRWAAPPWARSGAGSWPARWASRRRSGSPSAG